MAKVVTLTPNPALDIATHVDKLVPSHKLRCGVVRRDPGGGGINVARVVHRLGGDVVAVYAAGGSSGGELQELLQREGLPQRPVPAAGHTRESFNVTEDRSGEQFRFVLPGDPMSENEWKSCIDVSLGMLARGDYFVGSGSLPPDVPADFYARAVRGAGDKGAKTVIDTQGPSLRAVLDAGIDILKASARELGEYLSAAPSSPRDWRDASSELIRSGKCRIVTVTLGDRGAVLVAGEQAWHVAVPPVRSTTTVGAGDSFLGGLLVKLERGIALPDALRFASAAGTAALLTHGTALCDPKEVELLFDKLTAVEL